MTADNREQRVMGIIDRLTEQRLSIPLRDIEAVAEREGIPHAREVVGRLVLAGLVTEDSGNISKIAKHLFW